MVNRISKFIIGFTLAVLIVWGLMQLVPTEEKRIEKQLRKVASLMTFTGKEGNIARLTAANTLGDCFTTDAKVVLDTPSIGRLTYRGDGEIRQTALAVMSSGEGVNVEFDDPVIKVADDKQTATVDLTSRVVVTGERDLKLEELHLVLRKVDATWRISEVENLKPFGQ